MSSVQIIDNILRNMSLFKGLTDKEIAPVTYISSLKTYPIHSHLFMQGEAMNHVYFIHKGRIKMYKMDRNGRERIIAILQDGQMFPHAGFFLKGIYPAHAEIVEELTVIEISTLDFEQLLLRYPAISIRLYRLMGKKNMALQERLEEQIFYNTKEQVVSLLLRLAKAHGQEQDYPFVRLTTRFTDQELANMIGTSRETVNRMLNKLKKLGLVAGGHNGQLILDTLALKELLNNGEKWPII